LIFSQFIDFHLNILENGNMHTIQSWSITVVLVLQSLYFYFFVLQSFNSQAQTPMTAPPIYKKEIPLPSWQQPENIDDNLQPAIDLLHSRTEVIGNTIGLDDNQLAGTDAQRAADFQQQLDNPNIKAIWCVKGGYGTVRLLICWILPNLNKAQNGLLVLAISPFYTII
jgi:muramoyltetrapeptide carboxypeptidase